MLESKRLPTLDGPRVRLRALTGGDASALFAIFSDPEVMRYWSHPPFAEPAEAAAYVEETHLGLAEGTFYQWGVALRQEEDLVGTTTLWQLDERNRRCEIGFVLGRAHWGQGLMSEALTVLFDFAFGDLGLRRLEADVDPDNTPSISLLERLGFRREGFMRERWWVAGEACDSLFYGLLAREWRARPR